MDLRMGLALSAIAMVAPVAAEGCTAIPLLEPERAQVLADRQPVLRWAGPAQSTYRLQAVVMLPEARVLASYDIELTGTSFRIPAPIPSEHAGVKVLVTQGCGTHDAQDVQAQGAWFFVDVRGACVIRRETLAWRDGQLTWGASPSAAAYRVRLFKAPAAPGQPAQPLEEIVSTTTTLVLPEPLRRQAAAASVQPVCDGLPGRAEALPLVTR